MARVLKSWDGFQLLALPLKGARLAAGLKKGRAVSAGQALASPPSRPWLHAPVSGFIRELSERELIIERDDRASGLSPEPRPLSSLEPEQLRRALMEMGFQAPALKAGDTVIVNTLDEEPGLNCASALFSEQRETLAAGLDLLRRLAPDLKFIWALSGSSHSLLAEGSRLDLGPQPPYPLALPPLLRRAVSGRWDAPLTVLDGRQLYSLGRLWRGGLPLTQLVLSLGSSTYLVPLGSRVKDLLALAHLSPQPGDRIIVGGLVRGISLLRLEQGLGPEAAAVHLRRAQPGEAAFDSCRRCRRCRRACPLNLPVDRAASLEPASWPSLDLRPIYRSCLLCGACALACPSRRPLLGLARLNARGAP